MASIKFPFKQLCSRYWYRFKLQLSYNECMYRNRPWSKPVRGTNGWSSSVKDRPTTVYCTALGLRMMVMSRETLTSRLNESKRSEIHKARPPHSSVRPSVRQSVRVTVNIQTYVQSPRRLGEEEQNDTKLKISTFILGGRGWWKTTKEMNEKNKQD